MKKLGILAVIMALLASFILPSVALAGDASAYMTVAIAKLEGNGPYKVTFKILTIEKRAIFLSRLTAEQQTLVLRYINQLQTCPVSEYHAPFLFKPGKIVKAGIEVTGKTIKSKLVW